MRRRRKLLILLGGLVAAVGLLWANFGPDLDEVVDALWWKVAPKNFRRNKVRDFHRPSGGELLLIGTGHDLHFDSDVYPLGDLVAVLDNKDPSLVLVEIRPEDLAAGYRHMGPADMAYLAGAAAERGTEVRGFDWWDLESLRTALRHYDRDPVNDETRNQHMADLINKATEGQRSVVAFTGFSHIRPLTKNLVKSGWQLTPLSEEAFFSLWYDGSDDVSWDKDALASVERTLARLDRWIADEHGDNGWTAELKKKRDKLTALRASLKKSQAMPTQ